MSDDHAHQHNDSDHDHHHDHEGHGHSHDHLHGARDRSLMRTKKGMKAVVWSFAGLMFTALLQVAVLVWFSNSIALLADTIHNFADALTAVPLYLAFLLHQKQPSRRFSYGYGRVEDLAGLVITVMILLTACVAGYESVHRLLHPEEVQALPALAAAAIIGFLGNEAVALYRIHVGRDIGSAALVADGKHARADGLTSLAVLVGAAGIWGARVTGVEWLKLADPIVGLGITLAILNIVYGTGKTVLQRLLDGVDPEILQTVRETSETTDSVREVTQVRARWNGHDLLVEVNIAVDDQLTVEEGHNIAKQVQKNLLENLKFLSNALIHVDPVSEAGEEHHLKNTETGGDMTEKSDSSSNADS